MPALLIILGVFFAIKLKGFFVFHPIGTVKAMLKNQHSSFKSLTVALAGTLGIGNIVGVSSAILLGGAGSIFWMWISAICAMSIKYAEVYLAMRFRHYSNGKFHGGAPYYMRDGLKNKIGFKLAFSLSIIFAIFCTINSLTTGNLVQINSVSSLLPISPLAFGIIFTVFTFTAIIGGFERISKITTYLIPILSASYICICLYIILSNSGKMPIIFKEILTDAFSVRSASGGFIGYGLTASLRYGVSRGVLSNEAGCGTSPSAHASAENNNYHGQGCLGVFEVFVDTILLCSLTAFVILISKPSNASNPMELVLSSFEMFVGSFGARIVIFISILFAFATIICQYFYGVESLSYISKSSKSKSIFSFIFCLVLIVGAVIPMSLMWQISDLAIAVMTILNLICLFLLRSYVSTSN